MKKVYVLFWFDVEDYITPQSDDALKRIAEIFDEQNEKATFKFVGEKIRVLEARGRHDVIEKIAAHDIGYHTEMEAQLQEISPGTFQVCHCRDYARVDFRIDSEGNPYVLEINSMASLGPGGSFVLAAQNAGYTYALLVGRILDIAHERYFGMPAYRDVSAEKVTEGSYAWPGFL